MPTYEYQCRKCRKKFDQFQKMTDPRLKKCIYCRGVVDRLIGTGGGFIFKGTGFYATDYKKKTGEPAKTESTSKEPVKKEKTAEPKNSDEAKKGTG